MSPLFALLVAATLLPATAQAASFPKAEYKLQLDPYNINTVDYRFPSGLRILFQADHTQPIVSITNWIDRGSIYDGMGVNGESVEGIAHAVEHLAFRARHGDLPKNWDVINQLGGNLNASTSREWTNYMTVAPVDAAVPLLRIEALRLEAPLEGVTEEDVEAEKAIVRNELRMGYESGANGSAAVRTAFVHLPKLLYPEGHPYQNTTIGSHETVSHIHLADVLRFTSENYRPEYSTIAVIGDFDLTGGKPFNMIFQAFDGVEGLLMSPEDATKFKAITDQNARIEFLNKWVPETLVPWIEKTAEEPANPRVDCANKVQPPMKPVSQETITVTGMVDNPTSIVAWALPSGYCPDDVNMNIAANLLSNDIYRTLDPEYDPLKQEREIEGLGCFVDADKRGSILMCFIEKGAASKDTPERLVEKAADALYLQWAPIDAVFKPFYDNSVVEARMSAMSDVLGMTDNIASLWGRATFVSQHAHYTGSPNFFSDTIESYNTLDLEAARQLAKKYITRDRMVSMIIEPMDKEDRDRLEAGASEADKSNNVAEQHRAKDDRSRQLFDTEALTPEAVKGVTVIPDLAKIRSFTLDNGLQVAIMNHGEAPLVKVGLEVKGENATAPIYGLNGLAEALYDTGRPTLENPNENPLAVAGYVYRDTNEIYATGSSANLQALLHKSRALLEDYDWKMADKAQLIKKWTNTAKKDGEEPETWASRLRYERLFPDHPYGKWMAPADEQALGAAADLGKLKDWTQTKWQPANAYLVLVGKIEDLDSAEKLVRDYFSSWSYSGSGTPGQIDAVAPPASQPDRQVLLFDKPISTQSKVQLSCQLAYEGDKDKARTNVLGEILTFLAFERLREEKGLTYGAYAYPRRYRGTTTELIIASVIQNSGVGFGVKTMFDLVDESANGSIDDAMVRTNKWNVARTSVAGMQSGDQMLSTLQAAGKGNLDYFNLYRDTLANVKPADIQAAMTKCQGHEIVTVVGPVEDAKAQLDEAGIKYEVVDWEGLYESELSAKELKSYKKAKAKAEAEAAKKKAEEGASGT